MATTKTKNILKEKMAMRWCCSNSALRDTPPALLDGLANLEKLRLLLNKALNIGLPAVPSEWDLKKVKGFCEGILEPCVDNAWKSHLLSRHMCGRTRRTVASSLFMFRKSLSQEKLTPSEEEQKNKKYIEKMCSPQGLPDLEIIKFIKKETKKLFRVGWDRQIQRYCEAFTLPTKSCTEAGLSKGGARGTDLADRKKALLEFRYFWAGLNPLGKIETRVSTIFTGGKYRTVSVFPRRRSYLTPLHKLLYDRISECEWLLRGEATPDRFEGFERREGEVFVSGDYESATDNINIWLSRAILFALEEHSTHIPSIVWKDVHDVTRNEFVGGGTQSRGQLMGSVLSFPLLCLINYFTFKFALRRKGIPVRINGDDIVFRSTRREADHWMRTVNQSGLVLSVGKTLVLSNAFSLNSSFFLAKPDGCVAIPVIRSTCVFGHAESGDEIKGRLNSAYKGKGRLRDLVVAQVLRETRNQIKSLQGSVCRRLGAPVTEKQMRMAGLRSHEIFYLGLPTEPELIRAPAVYNQNCVPPGYVRVRTQREDHPDFMKEMIQRTWTAEAKCMKVNASAWDDYWRDVKEGTFSFVPISEKQFSLARKSVLFRRLGRATPERWIRYKPPAGKLSWQKVDDKREWVPGGVQGVLGGGSTA